MCVLPWNIHTSLLTFFGCCWSEVFETLHGNTVHVHTSFSDLWPFLKKENPFKSFVCESWAFVLFKKKLLVVAVCTSNALHWVLLYLVYKRQGFVWLNPVRRLCCLLYSSIWTPNLVVHSDPDEIFNVLNCFLAHTWIYACEVSFAIQACKHQLQGFELWSCCTTWIAVAEGNSDTGKWLQ